MESNSAWTDTLNRRALLAVPGHGAGVVAGAGALAPLIAACGELVRVVVGLVIGRRVRSDPGQGHARHRQRQGARIQRLSGSREHAAPA